MRRGNQLHDFGFYGESPEAFFDSKSRALVKIKSNIAYGGGGSAPSQPTQQTITQTTIPQELMPFAQKALAKAEALTDINQNPYTAYDQQRVAQLNPLQQQAYMATAGMAPSWQTEQASGMAGLAGLQAQQAGQYRAARPTNFYNPMDVSYMGTTAPQLQQYQMGGPERVSGPGGMERVGAGQFGGAEAGQYMSPYMQNVVEQQKQAAVQDYMRQVPGTQAAAARSGARGGTRDALMRAEGQRNLQQQLQGIQATGSQQAFQQAQQQFNVDQARALQAAQANQAMAGQYGQMGLQAALANQQAGLTTGQQNLAALLGVQSLGAQQGLQAQQLNQAAQLQAQQQALAQRQAGAQYGLAGAQLGESSRQFGANLGMQGIAQQLAAAQALGGLGQQAYGQQMGINQAQQQAGAALQALEQQRLDTAYQDFLAQQKYPYAQLGFFSDIIRGTPTSSSIQTMYQAPPSLAGQLAGGAAGLAGLYGAMKG